MSDNKSYRIRTDVLDDSEKYLRMKLDQDFDQLDVLSLSISQQQAYERFCSDYGAVVGRVVVNRGFGVPNVRVSIFVPLTDEDRENEKIRDLYPFERVNDEDGDGIRYNLLPKNRQFDCHTPMGTMPSKREILDNDTMIEVYDKYYRYSTVTNAAGDFMLFGVPVGQHTIHMDADLSDIGPLSRKPYHFIAEGRDPNEFASPTKFRETTNLDNAVHIETRNKGLTVRPFWGDTDSCEVGISRLDFTLSHELKTYSLFLGGVFTDSEKNSVNKNCRPRSAMGESCEVKTSEGTIEMIRKTPEGLTEDFSVNGGRVIDENGAWSYLIPLNLDNVVTDEFGDQIPSEDPNVGVSTRSSVRFKIGMDVTGGEGRLRRRAKYLVPHNPSSYGNSDYTFGQETSNEHFKDIYWNKIYTVSNHIARYQGSRGFFIINNRNFTGLKDVDGCVATNNPFPYNRINPRFSPLFNMLCIIFTMLTLIMYMINFTIIPVINTIITVVNAIISVINDIIDFINDTICQCWEVGNISILCCQIGPDDEDALEEVDYVPCLSFECGDTDYAPGCGEDTIGFDELGGVTNTSRTDLMNCLETQLAEALNLYQFDFYNDWINGSLYHFLFKYKLKNDGRRPKFCAYNCAQMPDDFTDADEYDDNTPNGSYNDCKTSNSMADTCVNESATDTAHYEFEDGIVFLNKEGELFYPPILHDSEQKMFATDIVHLGSLLDCDPNGVPKIFDELSASSYKLPPLFTQYLTDDENEEDVTGMQPLFFDLDCIQGLTTNATQCTNHKRLSELDVDVDETDIIDTGQPDGCINTPDMADDRLARDVITFYGLNNNGDNDSFDGNIDSEIALNCAAGYFNYFDPGGVGAGENGIDYNRYRDLMDNLEINNFERSYYFYFGLKPGASAYEKTISKYFDTCDPSDEQRLIIEGTVTDVSGFGTSDGEIDVEVLNGVPDYDYSWSGPNGFTSNSTGNATNDGDLTGLNPGFYTLNVIDDEGVQGNATFQVKGPPPLTCFGEVNRVPTHENASDGQLLVTFNNGEPSYTVEVQNTGGTNFCTFNTTGSSVVCSGLTEGDYEFIVTDSSSPSQQCSGTTTLNAPPELQATANTKDVTCFEDDDGEIDLNVNGTPPISTTAETSGGFFQVNGLSYSGLDGGATSTNPDSITYTVTIEDGTGQQVQQNVIISEPSQLRFDSFIKEDAYCNNLGDGSIEFEVLGGNPLYDVDIDRDGNTFSSYTDQSSGTPISETGLSDGNYQIEVVDESGCTVNTGVTINEPDPIIIDNIQATTNDTGELVITAGGGNPIPPIDQGTYGFRISTCGCKDSISTPCTSIGQPNNSAGEINDNGGNPTGYYYGDNNPSNTLTLIDPRDFDNNCDDDGDTDNENSRILKIEVMDTRALGKYGALSCNNSIGPECVYTEHVVVNYDTNGNGTPQGTYENINDPNLTEC